MLAFLALVGVFAVFLVLPGAILAACARFRPFPALALGAPITAGILAVLAQVFAWIRAPWTLPVVGAVLTFLVCFGVFLNKYPLSQRPLARHAILSEARESEGCPTIVETPPSRENRIKRSLVSTALPPGIFLFLTAVAFLGAGLIQFLPFAGVVQNFGLPHQVYDSLFHYSAVRVTADNAAAPWWGSLDAIYGKNHHGVYYPNQWYLIVALFFPYASIPFLSSAFYMALTLVCFPLGVALLAEYTFGQRSLAIPLALALSPVPLVPLYTWFLQSTYTNTLSLMWWPMALWTVLKMGDVLGRGASNLLQTSVLVKGILGGLVILATVQAHPSSIGFVALAVFAVFLNAIIKGQLSRLWWLAAVAVILLGLVPLPILMHKLHIALRARMASDGLSAGRALGAVTGFAQIYNNPWWLLVPFGLAVFSGLVWLSWRIRDWRFGFFFVAVTALVLATKIPLGPFTDLTGLWYGAFGRIGGGLVALLPVFAGGSIATFSVVLLSSRLKGFGSAIASILTAALLFGLVVAPISKNVIKDREQLAQIAFLPGAQFHPLWVSGQEFAALSSLELPAGSKIVGDPSTGEALVYPLTGIATYFPHMAHTAFDEDQRYLAKHFKEIQVNPRVCQILRREKINYFYDDKAGTIPAEFEYPGFHGVDTSRGFTKVATLDEATIYRIDQCD